MTIAWKILTAPQLTQLLAEGSFAGAPVDLADGYIHLSTAEQLPETLAKHFAGQSDLHLAAVDLRVLGDAVRWEESRGGALFPHIYGALPLAAMTVHGALMRDKTGTLVLPDPPPSGEGDHPQDGGGAQALSDSACTPPPPAAVPLPVPGRISKQ